MAFRLEEGEEPGAGVRRLALEQLDKAIEHLRSQEGERAVHVHEARKCSKRLRALVRLVRRQLGEQGFRRENACLREAARPLAGLRDATVLVETLDKLAAQSGGRRDRFRTVRRWLEERRQRAYGEGGAGGDPAADSLALFREVCERAQNWPLEEPGWKTVGNGLRQVYGRGRRTFARARREGGDEAYHEWRKWVKYLWYHLQVVRPAWPPLLEALAGELDLLGEWLGEDHDLAVLRQTVRAEMDRPVRPTTLQALDEQIAARQQALRARARRLGFCLYAESPRAFEKRLRACWRAQEPPAAAPEKEPALLRDSQTQVAQEA